MKNPPLKKNQNKFLFFIMLNPDSEPQQQNLYEHLAEGYRPIIASVGTAAEHASAVSEIKNIKENGSNVDYELSREELQKSDLKNAGRGTYVISPVDEKLKFTEGLSICTSFVAVGREKESGKEISFITHQDPTRMLHEDRESFQNHLKGQLLELKERCIEGSIDVAISGGDYFENDVWHDYERVVGLLESVTQENLGFSPLIICGPKEYLGKEYNGDNVYFDTQKRRLFVMRPEGEIHHNEVFSPSQLGQMIRKWNEEKKQRENMKEK